MLNDLPHFRYGGTVVINKLTAVLNDDKKIEGKYIALGLKSDKQKNRFFNELTKGTGIDKEALPDWRKEYSSNWGNEVAFPVLVAIFEILLLIAVCLLTVKELKNMGNLLLQGWSRKDFAVKIYSPILTAGFISMFLFIGVWDYFYRRVFYFPYVFQHYAFCRTVKFYIDLHNCFDSFSIYFYDIAYRCNTQ